MRKLKLKKKKKRNPKQKRLSVRRGDVDKSFDATAYLQVEKTTWDWVLMNEIKPIWLRNPKDVTDEEYNEFYKAFSKVSLAAFFSQAGTTFVALQDYNEPLTKIHFTAEGEVTFKCILYVPKNAPPDMFQNYGKIREKIKVYIFLFVVLSIKYIIPLLYLSLSQLYVRRVFITDDFEDMLPKYLNFIHGVVGITYKRSLPVVF